MASYICPMHPEVQMDKSGTCPKCGMQLITKAAIEQTEVDTHYSYKPLVIIIGFLALVTITLSVRDTFTGLFQWEKTMQYFMAGFFLIFSGFKFLDLKGFAEGYATYDLLAKRVFVYGYMYPFLELLLGLLYATGLTPPAVHIATFILMAFSGVGVALKLLKHEKFHCACLGTFLKVPLTKVTLVEDFGMAAMALAMLLLI